jgi:oligoendopeptidase F
MKTKLALLSILSFFGIGTLITAAGVLAQGNTNAGYSTIIQRLAQKFNLNPSDVKTVFDEVHNERLQQHQTAINDFLTQEVNNGKINTAQKQAILDKIQQLKDQRQSTMDQLKTMTLDQRKTFKQTKLTEMQTWAQENGINWQILLSDARNSNIKGVMMLHDFGIMGMGKHGFWK